MPVSSAGRAATATSAFAFLPEGSVIRDAADINRCYGRNVTAIARAIPLALRPASAEDIAPIVTEANKHRIPLYPISTGKNWGMGSKLPVTDGCAVLDLSRLNRIVEVNEALRYAVIEPGVTQGQLARYLEEHHPSLTFNLTGTFGETSIMGNTLERGDGIHARIDDLISLRGILGNGQPFEVGGHFGAGGSRFSWLPYLMLWLGLIFGGATGALLYVHYSFDALWFPAAWATLLAAMQWR